MAQNGKPKLEIAPGQEVRVKLVKPVTIGQNGYGTYYLYSLVDLNDGVAKSFFAPEPIHQLIEQHKVAPGSEFVLKRLENGKGSKIELALIGKSATEPQGDELKEVMRRCLQDAIDITKGLNSVPWQNDDIRAICSSLFIARTR